VEEGAMDRDEALQLLRGGSKGITKWNRRRRANEVITDLRGINLGGIDLSGTNFQGPESDGAYLNGVNLEGSNFSGAKLGGVDFREANLSSAILSATDLEFVQLEDATLANAKLDHANFFDVYLDGANFQHSILKHTKFQHGSMEGVNFSGAVCGGTVFASVDLSKAIGLENTRHDLPSTIGTDTLILSNGKIPEVFLRKCGLPEAWIANLPAFIGALEPIQFYSVFISYSSKDTSFAERLHANLQRKGVRCWYAPHDLRIGERIRVGIDEAIRVHDKLLLVPMPVSLAEPPRSERVWSAEAVGDARLASSSNSTSSS
jgi:hypothetical protein